MLLLDVVINELRPIQFGRKVQTVQNIRDIIGKEIFFNALLSFFFSMLKCTFFRILKNMRLKRSDDNLDTIHLCL